MVGTQKKWENLGGYRKEREEDDREEPGGTRAMELRGLEENTLHLLSLLDFLNSCMVAKTNAHQDLFNCPILYQSLLAALKVKVFVYGT